MPTRCLIPMLLAVSVLGCGDGDGSQSGAGSTATASPESPRSGRLTEDLVRRWAGAMKEIQDRSGAPAIEGEGNRASIRNILATLKQPGETREVLERHGLDEQQFPQVTADVLQWAGAPSAWPRFDLVVANLFLHHFEADKLAENVMAFIDQIRASKPVGVRGNYIESVTVSATMSPGVRVAL